MKKSCSQELAAFNNENEYINLLIICCFYLVLLLVRLYKMYMYNIFGTIRVFHLYP